MKEKAAKMDLPGNNGPAQKEPAVQTVAEAIREKSEALELLSQGDILALLKENHLASLVEGSEDDGATTVLTESVRQNDDLCVLGGAGSRYCYSSRFMTRAYATILLHKLEGPSRLIAETVRQSAREYERPVPLSIFTKPPFDLLPDEALRCLAAMGKDGDYSDIAATSTSTSVVYLYSTSYLDAEYADMLAEWFEVGQYDSP